MGIEDVKFSVPVDFKKATYINEPVVTQNDNIIFVVEVFDDGIAFDLSSISTFTLVSDRPGLQPIQTVGAKTATNEITFKLGSNETEKIGKINATIQLYDMDGRISTVPFTYQVRKDPNKDYIPSTDEQTLIELVLGEGPAILNAAQQAVLDAQMLADNLIHDGEYDNTKQYFKNNEARVNGYSYVATQDTLGNPPPIPPLQSNTHWQLRAMRGVDGTGSVVSVNNISPDENGNVELVIPDPDLSGLATKVELQTLDDEVATQLVKLQKKTNGVISVTEFGADPTGVLDSTDAFQEARDYLAAQTYPPALVFPAGIYEYSVSPNWAIQDATIISLGEVRFRYTGTENAILIDGGATGAGIHNMTFGQFAVEALETSKNGVYIRAVHHSKIDVKVLGCGANYAGLRAEWNVCNEFRVIVSGNEEGWYTNARPYYGVLLTKRNTGEDTSYCTFINPILEVTSVGAYLDVALGNSFFGGTMEGCLVHGTYLTPSAYNNKYYSVDFEVNADADIYCLGRENVFYSIDSDHVTILGATAKNNNIIGGAFNNITILTGASGNLLSGLKYNRFLSGGVISDSGLKTRFSDLYNMGTNVYHNSLPKRTVLTLGASPYTYTNNSGDDETLVIMDGTITQFLFVHNGAGDLFTATFRGFLKLAPGDYVTITYSSAPSMIVYK